MLQAGLQPTRGAPRTLLEAFSTSPSVAFKKRKRVKGFASGAVLLKHPAPHGSPLLQITRQEVPVAAQKARSYVKECVCTGVCEEP